MGTAVQTFPSLDLSLFEGSDATRSRDVARKLVAVCHEFGFVAVRGHGLPEKMLAKAFEVTRDFFALPADEKAKAPHPPTPKPHRGFSGLGIEKVYSEEDLEAAGSDASAVRQVQDHKESFEIGAETNRVEPNIWIPEEIMPAFKPYMLNFYDELDQVASRVLRALAVGLDIEKSQYEFFQMNSHEQNQMRLLHYPAIARSELGTTVLSRLPTHTDFSAFTMTFQDKTGGLEYCHPETGTFYSAEDTQNVLFLSIGTMLQQLTNDYFIAAEHRVSIPTDTQAIDHGLSTRYSIPYFVCPRHDQVIRPLDRFVTPAMPARYEPVRYDEYSARITKFQYVPPSEEDHEIDVKRGSKTA